MRRNYFYNVILTLALLLAGATASLAQVSPMRGIVLTKGADGKETPVADAQVDVFRIDLPGKFNIKTNKKGEFVFAGLPLVGTYVITVSAPNYSPDILANLRVGEDEKKFILGPGDGKRYSEAEAKAVAKGGAAKAVTSGESAEDKKKREEYEKQVAEINTKNAKVQNVNETLTRTFKSGGDALAAGNTALSAKNYEEAKKQYSASVGQYDEGLAADAEQPALLTNKAVALKGRGVAQFNASTTITDNDAKNASLEAARNDFRAAAETATKAVDMLKAQTAPTEAAAQTSYNNNKFAAISVRAECMRLFVTKVDAAQVETGIAAYQEYIAAEPDPVKKGKAQLDLASMVFDANVFDKALVEYQKVLVEQPDNPEALVRCGMALFNLAYLANDKTKFQEAANYLQRFVEKAPDSHPFKQDAVAVLDTLKKEQNVKPEKATPTRRKP